MIVWIVIAVLFLVTVVAAYFAAKKWHWGHVLVSVGIFLAAIGYFVLAAETLRMQAVLRSAAERKQEELDRVVARVEALREGTRDRQVINQLTSDEVLVREDVDEMPSITDLEHQLHLETRLRGKVWRQVAPAGFNPQTDQLQVTVEGPPPTGIKPDTILYVFAAGEPALPDPTRGAQFLGEFRVVETVGPQVMLQSTQPMDQFEQQRMAAARGPMLLYETMPVDRHELFAGRPEEQLRSMLPAPSVEEYLRHGGETSTDDDVYRRVKVDEAGHPVGPEFEGTAAERYQRRLRDYAAELDALTRQRIVMIADLAAVAQDNERLKAAIASAERLGVFREDEIGKLRTDLAGVSKEREIIEQHLATVQQQLANARALLDKAIAENVRLADELARHHTEWANRINEQAPAPASDGPLALRR